MPVTVAEHLLRAFEPRETERSPFRPPATLFRCVPLQKHLRPGPPPSGFGGGHREYGDAPMPPPPHSAAPPPHHHHHHHHHHHQAPPQPTPPLPASARAGLQPTAQPFVPGGFKAPEPEVPKARVTKNGTRWFDADDFAALMPSESEPVEVPAAVVEVTKKLLPQCPGWEVHPYVAGAAGAQVTKRDERGGLFSGKATAKRPERQLHHKVMSVLSRVTPQKYEDLKVELLALPIRQADDEQLEAVVEVFFKKAVQEDKFSHLYADLVQSIFVVANEEAAAAACSPTSPASPLTLSSPTYAEKTSNLAKNLRYTLLTRCQHEFERPYRLEPEDTNGPDGAPLPAEDIAERKYQLKKKLCGNIRFVGELYRCNIVTPRVINHILGRLLEQAAHQEAHRGPENGQCDDLLEVFVTLLTTVGSRFESKCPEETRKFIDVARGESRSNTHSARIKFLLMNLCDLADRNWVEIAPGSATPLSSSKRSIPNTPVTPAASKKKNAAPAAKTGKMPARNDTASRSFGNFPSSEASLNSGASTNQSPTKAKKGAAKKAESPTAPETPITTTATIAAVTGAGAPTQGLDAAQRARITEARARAEALLDAMPEARTLCEQLSTIASASSPVGAHAADAATSRANIVRNHLIEALTTRRMSVQRASLPALLQLLAECPVLEGTGDGDDQTQRVGSPVFKAAALGKVVCDSIKGAIVDGTFEDCPTLFANALELEPFVATAKSFAGTTSGQWRVLQPGAILAALADGIAEAAKDEETADLDSHVVGLGKAIAAARSGNGGEHITAALKVALAGAGKKGLPEELVACLQECSK